MPKNKASLSTARMLEEIYLDRHKRPVLVGNAVYVRQRITDHKGRVLKTHTERIENPVKRVRRDLLIP
jgi:acyl dehydratase